MFRRLFVAYAALLGVSLSAIFLVYTDASIAATFLVTGGTFGVMSIFGLVTRRDLTKLGSLLLMLLIGFVLVTAATHRLVSGLFHVEDRGAQSLKRPKLT